MKKFALTVSILALMAAPMSEVRADAKDVLLGIGAGVVGTLGVQHLQKKNQQKKQVQRTYSGPSSAQRQQNREVQTALNFFNYPVGAVDGALGPKSRAAISQMQADLGYVADGRLDDHERAFLIQSYHRAQGGAVGHYAQIMAAHGTKGLLQTYRSEQLNPGQTGNGVMVAAPVPNLQGATPGVQAVPNLVPQTNMVVTPNAPVMAGVVTTPQAVGIGTAPNPLAAPQPGVAQPPQLGVVTSPGTVGVPATPQPATPTLPQTQTVALTPTIETPAPSAPAAAALAPLQPAPTLTALQPLQPAAAPAAPVSLAQLCAATDQKTTAAGGPATAGKLGDPSQALNEQFCSALRFTIGDGKEKSALVQGSTPEQISALCQTITETIAPVLPQLSSSSPDAAVQSITAAVQAKGAQPSQFVLTGQICLGQAYASDKVEDALASAALLVAGGQSSYGELIGHHLRTGIGVTPDASKANDWQMRTLSALDAGATPAILPASAQERASVLRIALAMAGTANVQEATAAPAQNSLSPLVPLGASDPVAIPAAEPNAAPAEIPQLELIVDTAQ